MTVFEATVRDGVCRLVCPGAAWLSTGANGGRREADAAYNVTVPDGWPETDLAAYAAERRERAGFERPGPTLFTGVAQRHARRASAAGVEAVVTAGVSNPAALPTDPGERGAGDETGARSGADGERPVGTVNVVVGTDRSLPPGALANLVAVAAEAKATTLLAAVGVPGTTTDAVAVASDPEGERARFVGSATPVGRAARACVRDALRASLDARYAEERPPESVESAEHGVCTDLVASVSRL